MKQQITLETDWEQTGKVFQVYYQGDQTFPESKRFQGGVWWQCGRWKTRVWGDQKQRDKL